MVGEGELTWLLDLIGELSVFSSKYYNKGKKK